MFRVAGRRVLVFMGSAIFAVFAVIAAVFVYSVFGGLLNAGFTVAAFALAAINAQVPFSNAFPGAGITKGSDRFLRAVVTLVTPFTAVMIFGITG